MLHLNSKRKETDSEVYFCKLRWKIELTKIEEVKTEH